MRRLRRFGAVLGLALALLGVTLALQHWRLSTGGDLPEKPQGALRVATWNVHYILVNRDEGRWSAAAWERRKGPMDRAFKALDADIVAFQEMESFAGGNDDSANLARSWLLARNPGYAAAAIGDWRAFPSTQPILYRTDRLEALDQGWFFFSETPDAIYSRTFDGSYPAFASWADLRPRNGGETVRVVNVHLDYASGANRRRSTELIAGRVAGWIGEGRQVLLAADLNALEGSALHHRLEQAGLDFVPVRGASYHFDRGLNLFGAIDHVGHSDGLRPLGPAVAHQRKPGAVWPSDHYPVVVDLGR